MIYTGLVFSPTIVCPGADDFVAALKHVTDDVTIQLSMKELQTFLDTEGSEVFACQVVINNTPLFKIKLVP